MAYYLLFLFVGLVLSLSACAFPAWRDQVLQDLLEGRGGGNPSDVGTGSSGSQTVEFYDAGGRHLGYGVVRGATVDFYRPNGSRAGYGRAGR